MSLSEYTPIQSDELLDDLDHHFIVVAGPGAGKTYWLVRHIRNVLRNSARLTATSRVACISYTAVAADEVRTRLAESGEQTEVSTIHSFLYRTVVRPYVHLVSESGSSSEVDPTALRGPCEHRPIRGKLNTWISSNRPFSYLRKDTAAALNSLASLYWKLEEAACTLRVARQHTFGGRYSFPTSHEHLLAYKRLYWREGLIHHEDVLYFAFRILQDHPQLRPFLTSRYPYVFLDEFQDTNFNNRH